MKRIDGITKLSVVSNLGLGLQSAGLTFAQRVSLVLFIMITLVGIVVGFPETASADPIECKDWVAKIVSIEGRVESLPAGETSWQAVKLDDTYCPEDRVRTLEKSRAAFILKNETVIRLDENTMVKFSSLKPESPSLLELLTGSAFFMSRYPRPLTVETPYVNAASGGTEFNIKVNPDDKSTTITVIEGQMNLTNEAGSAVVKAGEEAVAKSGQPPVVRIPVRPRDAIQWALYYPPIMSLRDLRLQAIEGLPETDWRSMVQRSITAYNEGDVGKAFSALEGAPAEINDPRFYVYRASLLLSVGQVGPAKSDIEQALKLVPGNGLALALQSVIAVVQNEKESALKLALEAAQAEPESVSVKIALSYAEQANFKLDEALAAVQEAVKLDPEASLAWARSAELWMAQGYLDKALEAANKAAALNPKEVRIQTVLGFAYLTEIKIRAAKEAFEKAIALNSADPMPRLGLGLAMIREGNLEEGRKEIEIAASLDPNNALIRSYLGKAYYEEKRDPQAEIQFQQAEQLDPKDPTPYFYDAIRKQTVNRPVEALHDLEKSIELNDNRAVYRSQLLLDNDQAARSVSLARIYDDLGFQNLGLVEGWKSVNLDPANYSAHRLLADSYASMQRSEISRVSELLQAQLLQPLNSNPVQPRLGESAPAILAGAGPVDPSFNEYSQLFIRDRNQLLVSGIVGNQSTFGDEVILSGLQGRYSYSLSQFHESTDGFRTNADLRQTIYDVFSQVSLTPKASIQGEFRFNKVDNGDIDLRFDPDNFSPTQDNDLKTGTYRLGFHYAVAPGSHVLASLLYQKFDQGLTDTSIVTVPPSPPLDAEDAKSKSESFTGEVQYLHTTDRFNFISGAGQIHENRSDDFTAIIGLPIPPPFNEIINNSKTDIRHTNLYAYFLLNLPFYTTFTLGGSGDLYKGTPRNKDQFNPKFGLTWNLTPSTTLRLAGFRVFKRNLVSNQTLEPTQVAGFQQFFDDLNGTDSKRYGIGIDQKFSKDFFGGLEVSKRDVQAPFSMGTSVEELGIKEYLNRAYLYWTLHRWLTASAEYQLERLDSDDFTNPLGPKVNTNRVPLGLNFFHPSGFFAKLEATYIHQEGQFLNVPEGPFPKPGSFESREDQFWLADASVGYRLPKRLGIFTIVAKNLTDRNFRFQDTVLSNPLIQPKRLIFAKLTLSF